MRREINSLKRGGHIGGAKMARPKQLNNPRVVSIIFEGDIYEELKRIAERQNTSVSSLIRQLVLQYYFDDSNSKSGDPADPPSNAKDPKEEIDPLVELELEELSEWIRGFEADLAEYQNMKKNPPKPSKNMPEWEAKNAIAKYKYELQNKKNSLVSDWQFLKKKFEKLHRRIPKAKEQEISKKLADLKRKLKN
jgi:predicted CopG family antitoxin